MTRTNFCVLLAILCSGARSTVAAEVSFGTSLDQVYVEEFVDGGPRLVDVWKFYVTTDADILSVNN